MQQRILGRQGLEVSALGLGCMGMTFAYSGAADPAECEDTLLEAVDRGVTLIDTAEVYGPYSNEQLLGRCLAGQAVRAEEFPEGDYRRNQPRLQDEHFDANRLLLVALEALADRVRATPAQVALAWLLAQGPDVVPIFGTTRRGRLRENLGALDARLATSDLSELERVFAPGSTSGERYGAAGLAMLDRGPGR